MKRVITASQSLPWTEAYKIFTAIANIYLDEGEQVVNKKVDEVYEVLKGNPVVDAAWSRWNVSVEEG